MESQTEKIYTFLDNTFVIKVEKNLIKFFLKKYEPSNYPYQNLWYYVYTNLGLTGTLEDYPADAYNTGGFYTYV